ncbi:FtsX-like permease family protein [Actinoplanes sp. NPDC026619]|uniref:FtsX-like permease family protein n=1 Tax=Actinoplanes sp. NPDC026619 TaxID=3155798 RepID=UPI003400A79D
MSVTVHERPPVLGAGGHGGMPARRAVLRWAWRMFRREWRQQSIVLALLLLTVAATTLGLGIGANAPSDASVFGTANYVLTVSSAGPPTGGPATGAATGDRLGGTLDALRSSFGTTDVIRHGPKIPFPGSATGFDLRDQDPAGPYGRPMLRLDQGRWPQGPDEIAVTDRVAAALGLGVGGGWDLDGRRRAVTALVENPLDLHDEFALVAPGQIAAPDHADVLVRASADEVLGAGRPAGVSVQERFGDGNTASVLVLMFATVGLVFAGLMAAAGFTVLGRRRLRAIGMLGAIGASHRHVRLVLLADGLIVGSVGAAAGAAVGVAGWIAFSPRLEESLAHRVDRYQLPWTALVTAVVLATVTAVAAAWWPARAAARTPVVAALSARPAPPHPAHRFAALGAVLLIAGLTCLYLSEHTNKFLILGGILGTAAALMLLAPVAVAALGRVAARLPLAARLALRDLARYRSRSGAALAAIGLAIGIAAVVSLSAAVTVAKVTAPSGGNVPADQIIIWLDAERMNGTIPVLSADQLADRRARAGAIAGELHATSVLTLTGAASADTPLDHGGRPVVALGKPTAAPGRPGMTAYRDDESIPVYVATPELLAHYGIAATTADLLTPRASIDGYDLIRRRGAWQPTLQHVSLPDYTSAPNVLLSTEGMARLGLTAMPVGWLVQAPGALTQAQVDRAQQAAAAAGFAVESRPTGADQARLAAQLTAAGIAVALGVLAMTVGLIRSETARDLRTLAAAGARRRTRRGLTAATAGALALGGAIIGTACAYLALLAWFWREAHWLAHPPVFELIAILAGLPVVAYAGGWLLAGREPGMIARQPLD